LHEGADLVIITL